MHGTPGVGIRFGGEGVADVEHVVGDFDTAVGQDLPARLQADAAALLDAGEAAKLGAIPVQPVRGRGVVQFHAAGGQVRSPAVEVVFEIKRKRTVGRGPVVGVVVVCDFDPVAGLAKSLGEKPAFPAVGVVMLGDR